MNQNQLSISLLRSLINSYTIQIREKVYKKREMCGIIDV